MNIRRFLPLVAVFVAVAIPANAQIYKFRDKSGAWVFSNTPPAGYAPTYPVVGASELRATRPAVRSYANLYDSVIEKHSATYGVRPDLVRAVMQVESGFNPLAKSAKGARGLMQLMPSTAADLGVRNIYDPDENVRGGVAYLSQLLAKYGNNEELALAAYNAGPDAVQRHGNQVPPYRETRDYVKAVRNRTPLVRASAVNAVETIRPSGTASRRSKASASAAAAAPPATGRVIYRTIEIREGRAVPKYSDTPPADGTPYEVVPRR